MKVVHPYYFFIPWVDGNWCSDDCNVRAVVCLFDVVYWYFLFQFYWRPYLAGQPGIMLFSSPPTTP